MVHSQVSPEPQDTVPRLRWFARNWLTIIFVTLASLWLISLNYPQYSGVSASVSSSGKEVFIIRDEMGFPAKFYSTTYFCTHEPRLVEGIRNVPDWPYQLHPFDSQNSLDWMGFLVNILFWFGLIFLLGIVSGKVKFGILWVIGRWKRRKVSPDDSCDGEPVHSNWDEGKGAVVYKKPVSSFAASSESVGGGKIDAVRIAKHGKIGDTHSP